MSWQLVLALVVFALLGLSAIGLHTFVERERRRESDELEAYMDARRESDAIARRRHVHVVERDDDDWGFGDWQ